MIHIVQTDNRIPSGYISLSLKTNKRIADTMGWNHIFKPFNISDYGSIHPATAKIWIVYNILKGLPENDIIVFLDCDAWIQSPIDLQNIISKIIGDNKHGAFSRDPYVIPNTYINSGSFIVRNTKVIQSFYEECISKTASDKRHLNSWPFDQYYISNAVFEKKDLFIIFEPLVLNTPNGIVLRHNWFKNKKMFADMESAGINNTSVINLTDPTIYDSMPWPNTTPYTHDEAYWKAKMTPA